jgi:hypothetical protein
MGPALGASVRAGIGGNLQPAAWVPWDLWDMSYPELGTRADKAGWMGASAAHTPNMGR